MFTQRIKKPLNVLHTLIDERGNKDNLHPSQLRVRTITLSSYYQPLSSLFNKAALQHPAGWWMMKPSQPNWENGTHSHYYRALHKRRRARRTDTSGDPRSNLCFNSSVSDNGNGEQVIKANDIVMRLPVMVFLEKRHKDEAIKVNYTHAIKKKKKNKSEAPHLFVYLLCGLGVTEGHGGQIFEDRHLHGAVAAVEQRHQGARVHGSIHNLGTNTCRGRAAKHRGLNNSCLLSTV